VTVLPGPSAVETALVASGLGAERYQFLGYLPRGAAALASLGEELARWPHAVVAFESPQRIVESLERLAPALGERPVAVCRELTKKFEETVRGTSASVAAELRQPVKGEITLVVGPADMAPEPEDESAAASAVAELVAAGVGRRAAADLVSRLTGVPRNSLYRGSL
jgi:16S rRNA (cytidine1402-2'-O)-methyltransferase